MKKYIEPSVIYGKQFFSLPSHMNYGLFVLENMLKSKEKVALINGETGEQITYGELAQRIVNVASSLMKYGVKDEDVIGICSENRIEFMVALVATQTTVAAVTCINSAYGNDEFIHSIRISKPRILFLSPKAYTKYHKLIIEHLPFVKEIFVFGETLPNVKSFDSLVKQHTDISSFKKLNFSGTEKTVLILYSSGTTGLPKGAKLSHRNLIISGLRPLAIQRDLVCLSLAPWVNTVGIILTLNQIINNITVVFMTKFYEEIYLQSIQKYKVGLLLAVPPLVFLLNKSTKINKYDVSSVQYIYCGGAPLDESVIEVSKKILPHLKHVLQGYGMTEASGAITEETDTVIKQGSIGKVVDGITIKVVDTETRKLLGPNQTGEICIKGPVLFQSYIGKSIDYELDEDKFYKTGDIGYYDEDGFFYIVDRLKELIKYKAGQVAPSELEGILRQHPGVKDVGVVGTPDPLAGELPTAFVVKTPGVNVTEKALIDFVANKVSSWKQLRGGVIFVNEIPKTGSGKILRRHLRDMIAKPKSSKL